MFELVFGFNPCYGHNSTILEGIFGQKKS